MFPHAGDVLYMIEVTEFQKRGLPHAHILVKYASDCNLPDLIDSVISAELPEDVADAALVHQFMLHNHPSPESGRHNGYCQRQDKDGNWYCRFHYLHPQQESTTIDREGRVSYRRRKPEDSNVVPHCLPLLRKFRCHINVEAASSSHLFQYLFKYIHKGIYRMFLYSLHHLINHLLGPDRTRFRIATTSGSAGERVDEIEEYYSARYLSAMEATWRILGFHITLKDPGVSSLPIHLPSSTSHHQYARNSGTHNQSLSLLERYFLRPPGVFTGPDGILRNFESMSYTDYFTIFRLAKFDPDKVNANGYFRELQDARGADPRHVILRTARDHISRLQQARPSEGERFYLRTLLQHKTARSFNELLTVDGIQHSSFQEAARALGLFTDDNEASLALDEAVHSLKTPRQIRILFVHLLVNDCIVSLIEAWERFNNCLSYDFSLRPGATIDVAYDLALDEIGHYLEEYGKSLSHFGLPEPVSVSLEVAHELAQWSPQQDLLSQQSTLMVSSLNIEQRAIFDTILQAVTDQRPLLLFIDGKAGRGKTYLVNTICTYMRSRGHIVLPTATAGNAARLYPGGRTTHSAFKVGYLSCQNVPVH